MDVLSKSEARRVALAAQGFDRPRPARVDIRHLRRTIHGLGLVQIDFVNVVLPAHYQVPFSRLGPYDRSSFHDLVYRRGEFTELFAHEESIIPVETWPLVRHARIGNQRRAAALAAFMARHERYASRVLADVRARGPLSAKDLPDPEDVPRRSRDEWSWWSVPRAALEGHYVSGALAVAGRKPDFSRTFDLAERVLPARHLDREIGLDEARRELLLRAATCLGVGTIADLADYYRMPVREIRPRVEELLRAGELKSVRVEGWNEPAYLHRDARLPKRIEAAALLSPFDPVVWFRPRTARLFDFDYRVEIFVPQSKRKWGYYVLPFLLGDRLVARVDLKADRGLSRLCVLAAYVEPGVESDPVAHALAAELQSLAAWLGLDSVSVGRKGGFSRDLSVAVRSSRSRSGSSRSG